MGVIATDGRELSTYDEYILFHNAPRPHNQTTLSTTNTRNGPVTPQYAEKEAPLPAQVILNCYSFYFLFLFFTEL